MKKLAFQQSVLFLATWYRFTADISSSRVVVNTKFFAEVYICNFTNSLWY